MFFGKRDKKTPNERVEDLKARVDALRQADQTRRRPQSLDQFLEGDDVLTGREVEDNYRPTGFSPGGAPPNPDAYEAALAAELEKYLQREAEREALKALPAEAETPRTPAPASEPESLLLDGTWSRDGDRRSNLTAADRAWGVYESAFGAGEGPNSAPASDARGDEREAV
jgi:hypothetical protein